MAIDGGARGSAGLRLPVRQATAETAVLLVLALVAARTTERLLTRPRRAPRAADRPLATGGAVRPLERGDLAHAALLHADALPDGFFAQLGPHFLSRYLATFLDVPGAVALAVDTPEGRLAGFAVGSTGSGATHHRSALRLHGWSLLVSGLLALSTRPRVLAHFVHTRAGRYARALMSLRRRPEPRPVVRGRRRAGRTAVLLHVVVSPTARGGGAGRTLLAAFEDAGRAAGCTRGRLVSFSDTEGFYRRLGWDRLSHRVDRDGRDVVTYGRDL